MHEIVRVEESSFSTIVMHCFVSFQARVLLTMLPVVGEPMVASVMVVVTPTAAITRQMGPTTIQLERHWCVVRVVNRFVIGIC